MPTIDHAADQIAYDACYDNRPDVAVRVLTEQCGYPADVAERLAACTRGPRVGDVLVESWGYDQTNIDFYQVVAVTKASVKIRAIGSRLDASASNQYQDAMVPVVDKFLPENSCDRAKCSGGKTSTRRFKISERLGSGYSIRITDWSWAYLWDGTPQMETAAGYGH